MPNPAIAKSFTPVADGLAICTAVYSVQQFGTASDWGGTTPGSLMHHRRDSDAATLHTGSFQPCTRTRMSQIYRTTFPVLASDGAQTISLDGTGGAPGTSIQWWDLDLTIELIKR